MEAEVSAVSTEAGFLRKIDKRAQVSEEEGVKLEKQRKLDGPMGPNGQAHSGPARPFLPFKAEEMGSSFLLGAVAQVTLKALRVYLSCSLLSPCSVSN